MSSGWTNRGKYNALAALFRGISLPANFYYRLFTAASAPGPDTNTVATLTEIADGNGYTQGTGYTLALNSTDFDVLTEDDTNDRALVQIKDMVFTASGGPIPASGNGARYGCLCGATGGLAEVWAYHDFTSDRSVSDGQSLTIQDAEFRLTEPA